MKISRLIINAIVILMVLWVNRSNGQEVKEIQRPEKIFSKREVVYDKPTYAKLTGLWKQYNEAFPSEDAYANWMYAARYAQDPDYEKLLEKGYKKYPGNPTLIYLYAMNEYECHSDPKGLTLMEKAAALDPAYQDPWYALAGYYINKHPEKLDIALRHLLECSAVPDEIMDFNYNMLAGLAPNAILVTNGDMDTYPGWILTRIVKFRPDVTIANISLLNTDWYPLLLMKGGAPSFNTEGALKEVHELKGVAPKFITEPELKELREKVLLQYKDSKKAIPAPGPYSDTLLTRLIEASTREGRPVYFAVTLYPTEAVKRYSDKGFDLGLVTLVTPATEPYPRMLQNLVKVWLNDFRTGGLDSWRVRHAKAATAGRIIVSNYPLKLSGLLEAISKYAPESRLDLFHWHQKHTMELIPEKYVDTVNQSWYTFGKDIKEIQDWGRSQGYGK
jgi:hypothetical protein